MGKTLKPYLLGSAILLGGWLLLVGIGGGLAWIDWIDQDTAWIIAALAIPILVGMRRAMIRYGLTGRHLVPMAIGVGAVLVTAFLEVG
jgi:hypothetical protein